MAVSEQFSIPVLRWHLADDFAVLLHEPADVGVGQEIEHFLRRAAEPQYLRRHDDRALMRMGAPS